MLDLGTVVGQEHDSRDLFEKVFRRLDADSSLDVTRAEFKRYFCPMDEPRPRASTNDDASPGSPSGRPGGASNAPEVASPSAAARSAAPPSPPHSPRAPPALGQSSVSVFSQASGSAREDWPLSPPPPTGGCCGIGAKRAKAPPRAAAYRAPGASPLAAPSVRDSVGSPNRSPSKSLRPTAAREGDGAARTSPLAPRRAEANAADGAAATSAVEKVVEKVVEKGVEKKGYNISDEELVSLKEELELLREQVRSKGETLRSKDARLDEMEKENATLRAEFNLQSLKQDMLVHMWSMHMLDADAEDDAST